MCSLTRSSTKLRHTYLYDADDDIGKNTTFVDITLECVAISICCIRNIVYVCLCMYGYYGYDNSLTHLFFFLHSNISIALSESFSRRKIWVCFAQPYNSLKRNLVVECVLDASTLNYPSKKWILLQRLFFWKIQLWRDNVNICPTVSVTLSAMLQ